LSTDEADLIRRAQRGDHDAFLRLLAQYDRRVMAVVYRFSGDLYDREDLYQDIFLACFRSLPRFRFRSSFASWLHRVALNRCIDYMNKKPPVLEAPDEATAPPDWERREKLRAVQRAMSRLRGPQRIAFFLRYIEDWDEARIAETLDCSQGAVKSHLHRARTKIRQAPEVMPWQSNPI